MSKNSTPFISYSGHRLGSFDLEPSSLDLAMLRYLPASLAQLRDIAQERDGREYYDVYSVSEMLMILARQDEQAWTAPIVSRKGR